MKSEPKTIYCPKCKRKVGQWDGRSTIRIIVAVCHHCNKRIVYNMDTEEAKVSDMPTRSTSSGMTFI